jgi:hypothetical protein
VGASFRSRSFTGTLFVTCSQLAVVWTVPSQRLLGPNAPEAQHGTSSPSSFDYFEGLPPSPEPPPPVELGLPVPPPPEALGLLPAPADVDGGSARFDSAKILTTFDRSKT